MPSWPLRRSTGSSSLTKCNAAQSCFRTLRAEAPECYFWATHTGGELDLLVVRGGRRMAFECKYSSAPRATRSMQAALDALDLDDITIVCPGESDSYPLTDRIRVTNLAQLAKDAKEP